MGTQGNAEAESVDRVINQARSSLGRAGARTMDDEYAACDNLSRAGVCLGMVSLLAGLVIAALTLGRSVGFGAAGVLGSEAVHIQARVQLFGGCLPILVGLIWALATPQDQVTVRLRPLVRAIIVLGFVSGASVMALNWAILMGRVADHLALLPALLDAITATLYLVLLVALPVGANVAVASHLMLRSGALWLLVYSLIRLTATSGRVFLDQDRFMWFFDMPSIEMAILGCVVPSAIALMLGAMSSIGDPRAIMRSLPMQLQFWHSTVFLWLGLRVWCLRYPGSYQKLVLALVGIALLVVISTVVSDTSIFQRILIPTRRSARRRDGLNLAGVALSFMVLSCLVLVATAMVAAGMNNIPPPELFAALLMAGLVGVPITATGSVLLSIAVDYPERVLPATGFFVQAILASAAGTLIASLLWPLTIIVERSLTTTILGATALTVLGTGLALLWIALAWCPWQGVYDESGTV